MTEFFESLGYGFYSLTTSYKTPPSSPEVVDLVLELATKAGFSVYGGGGDLRDPALYKSTDDLCREQGVKLIAYVPQNVNYLAYKAYGLNPLPCTGVFAVTQSPKGRPALVTYSICGSRRFAGGAIRIPYRAKDEVAEQHPTAEADEWRPIISRDSGANLRKLEPFLRSMATAGMFSPDNERMMSKLRAFFNGRLAPKLRQMGAMHGVTDTELKLVGLIVIGALASDNGSLTHFSIRKRTMDISRLLSMVRAAFPSKWHFRLPAGKGLFVRHPDGDLGRLLLTEAGQDLFFNPFDLSQQQLNEVNSANDRRRLSMRMYGIGAHVRFVGETFESIKREIEDFFASRADEAAPEANADAERSRLQIRQWAEKSNLSDKDKDDLHAILSALGALGEGPSKHEAGKLYQRIYHRLCVDGDTTLSDDWKDAVAGLLRRSGRCVPECLSGGFAVQETPPIGDGDAAPEENSAPDGSAQPLPDSEPRLAEDEVASRERFAEELSRRVEELREREQVQADLSRRMGEANDMIAKANNWLRSHGYLPE